MKNYFEEYIFMEIRATQIDTANLSIIATIFKDDIEKNLEKIAKDVSKSANIPGFRKGKVPVSAVKKHYGARLVEDAEAEALRAVLDTGLNELKVDNSRIITEPAFSKFERVNGNIEVVVEVSLRPELTIADYENLVPEIEEPTVSEDEIDGRINDMVNSSANFVEVDRAVENGDQVNLDFEGFVDGVAFQGGKAEGYSLKIGSGSFIPGFEDQLIGLKKGEEKDISVKFPEEYQSPALKGKDATFKCKINGVEQKEERALSEDVATDLIRGEVLEGKTAIETLRSEVKQEIINEKLSKKYNNDLKPLLRNALAEKFVFDLPLSVLEKEIEQRVNQSAQTMTAEEIEAIKNSEEKLNELKATHKDDAEKSVRTTFIIDALGKKENIVVDDKEVEMVLFYEAMASGQDHRQLLDMYQKNGLLPLIKMAILEDKILTKILDDKFKK
jgi:trigger factor